MPLNRGLNRFSGPHQPGGFPWAGLIHGAGVIAKRPPACAANAGLLHYATDVNGGTLYRSTGTAWVQVASPALAGDGTYIQVSGATVSHIGPGATANTYASPTSISIDAKGHVTSVTAGGSSGPAPTGAPTLTATPGNAQVTIGITLGTGSTNTYVYRGTAPGVTNLTGTLIYSGTGGSYVDTGRTNGTTYYYVGYGWNNGLFGPASAEVSATPNFTGACGEGNIANEPGPFTTGQAYFPSIPTDKNCCLQADFTFTDVDGGGTNPNRYNLSLSFYRGSPFRQVVCRYERAPSATWQLVQVTGSGLSIINPSAAAPVNGKTYRAYLRRVGTTWYYRVANITDGGDLLAEQSFAQDAGIIDSGAFNTVVVSMGATSDGTGSLTNILAGYAV